VEILFSDELFEHSSRSLHQSFWLHAENPCRLTPATLQQPDKGRINLRLAMPPGFSAFLHALPSARREADLTLEQLAAIRERFLGLTGTKVAAQSADNAERARTDAHA